jgi:tripartite ATP-independent transporter DctM subunit
VAAVPCRRTPKGLAVELIVLMVALLAMILVGAPIGVTMAVLPAIYIALTDELPLATVPYQMYESIASAPLIAIPFFLLTGALMNSGQITERLLLFSRELVGRVRGGMAQTMVLVSMLFAGMSGSAVADTAAVGGVLIPAMKKEGYHGPFAAALCAVAGTIGGIIPPSIVMILLAGSMGLSTGALFMAGVLPGLAIGLLLMVVAYVISVRRGYPRYEEPFRIKVLARAFLGALPPLAIPLVIILGMVFGVFTATEAGAITVLVATVIGVVLYRSLTLVEVGRTFVHTVKVTSSVFFILAASGPFSWLLNRIGALKGLEGWFMQYAGSPVLFTLLVGTVIETIPAIVVLAPTLIKVSVAAGFHEIQAALVLVVGFIMGAVTPPVGIVYFTAAFIAKEPLEKVGWALIPFMAVEVLVMFIILLVPALTLWLPKLVGFL